MQVHLVSTHYLVKSLNQQVYDGVHALQSCCPLHVSQLLPASGTDSQTARRITSESEHLSWLQAHPLVVDLLSPRFVLMMLWC